MLTLFSIPKPFEGESDLLQRNAVASWRASFPEAEIMLLGGDAGVAECARANGARHLPEVAVTQWGTPRVDDIFARAEAASSAPLLCYINADILLTRSFGEAARTLARERHPFLAVGRRWDLDWTEAIDFSDAGWEARLRAAVSDRGQLHAASGIDFFLYPRGFWRAIPPFGVGRTMWDNWFIFDARARGAMVADVTADVAIIHQNHGYGHHAQGWQGVWKGPEALRNEELAGGPAHYFTIDDATHRLERGSLRRRTDAAHWEREWHTLPVRWKPAARAVALAATAGKRLYALREKIARWRGRIR